jgi:hypothetical protein
MKVTGRGTIEIDFDPPTLGRLVLRHAGKQRRGAVEQVACLANGEPSVRGATGQMEVFDRPLGLACALEVKPEDRSELFPAIGVSGLHRIADLAMEPAPVCLQERFVSGFLDEDVTESVDRLGVDRGDPHEACSLGLPQRPGGRPSVAGDRFEEPDGNVAPDHCGEAEDPAGFTREAIDSGRQQALQRRRHLRRADCVGADPATIAQDDPPALDQHPDHFLHEEWVAVGPLNDEVPEPTWQRLDLEEIGHEGAALGLVEWRKGDLG